MHIISALKTLNTIPEDRTFISAERRRLALVLEHTPPIVRRASRARFLTTARLATALAVLIVTLGAGGGVVFGAQSKLPGQMLYPVKIVSEKARLVLTPGRQAKARLYLKYARRRTAEAEAIADGKVRVPALTAEKVLTDLKEKLEATSASEEEVRGIDEALDRIERKVSGDVKSASRRARAALKNAAKRAEKIREHTENEKNNKIK